MRKPISKSGTRKAKPMARAAAAAFKVVKPEEPLAEGEVVGPQLKAPSKVALMIKVTEELAEFTDEIADSKLLTLEEITVLQAVATIGEPVSNGRLITILNSLFYPEQDTTTAVVPLTAALAKRGYISGEQRPGGNRPKMYYVPTKKGRDALKVAVAYAKLCKVETPVLASGGDNED